MLLQVKCQGKDAFSLANVFIIVLALISPWNLMLKSCAHSSLIIWQRIEAWIGCMHQKWTISFPFSKKWNVPPNLCKLVQILLAMAFILTLLVEWETFWCRVKAFPDIAKWKFSTLFFLSKGHSKQNKFLVEKGESPQSPKGWKM